MTHTANTRPAPEAQSNQIQSTQLPLSSSFHREYLELLYQIRPVKERAERLRLSVFERAATTCRQAGFDPAWASMQLYNYLIDCERGHVWAGVDPLHAHLN